MIGRIDGIHVPGQQHPALGRGPHPQHQVRAVLALDRSAVGRDLGHRRGFFQRDLPGQRRERVGKLARHRRQPRKVAGAAIDGAPALGAGEHRGWVDPLDQPGLFWQETFHRKLFTLHTARLQPPGREDVLIGRARDVE